MKTLHLAIIVGLVSVLTLVIFFISENDSGKIIEFGCKDPQQEQLQYNNSRLELRREVDKIVLQDPQIKQIIGDNYCEFMAGGTMYTENGTYQTININLNNTQELSVIVDMKNASVINYKLGGLHEA
jgi:hypothetical protein